MKDDTTVRMAGALAAVANNASVKAAAQAHDVTVPALYKAMKRHGLRDDERCSECGRLLPRKAGT